MATAPLPTSRAFLTNLIDTISNIPIQPPDLPPHRQHEPPNPLKQVPPSHRPLLTTLHVLFPTLLLPALDLLDRRRVTRLWLVPKAADEERYDSSPTSSDEDEGGEDDDHEREERAYAGHDLRAATPRRRRRKHRLKQPPEDAAERSAHLEEGERDETHDEQARHEDGEQDEAMAEAGHFNPEAEQPLPHSPSPPPIKEEEEEEPISHIYTVKSSQSTHPSRRKEVLLGGVTEDPSRKIYVVRLGAWNCTCAAFVFASFPGGGHRTFRSSTGIGEDDGGERSGGGGREGEEEEGGVRGDDGGEKKRDWEFGGVSLDGTARGGGGGVPCCKHLLACLLAERWTAGLGGYVEERRVGRNEMAGIIADL
ncbi:hypothetical protein GE09DRAFT_1229020 [Coniochaeta sp. 2T2.1]|nr:hypothetical protein GE09DRAFT_1229020 [Coniochaeta sp. 2T2.1]